jgi:hypothetical protein
MADFKISRFKYTWKGLRTAGTEYFRDDVVRVGAYTYVCIRQHLASEDFYSDLTFVFPGDTQASPAWVKMTQGFSFEGEWFPNSYYQLGDTVSYKSFIYLCIQPHTSSSEIEPDLSNWTVYSRQITWREDWTPLTKYTVNDIVKYGGLVYICLETHISSATTIIGLESDLSKWDRYFENIEYKGSFNTSTRYKLNDLVYYRGSIFRCIESHVSGSTFNETTWSMELPGSRYEESWSNSFYYGKGSVVKYGGNLYLALSDNINQNPFDSIYQSTTVIWKLLKEGLRFIGNWNSSTQYKVGDVVRRGGNLYVARLDTVSDGSSVDYLDTSNWRLLTEGSEWRSNWSVNNFYQINELVTYNGNLYKSTVSHISNPENYPGDNGNGFDFWSLVIESQGEDIGLSDRGDLVTFDLSRTETGDGSTFGPTPVKIGNKSELLTINDTGSLFYKKYGHTARVRYVAPNGVDDIVDPERGISPFYPWKTIRFACEQVDDNFEGTTNIFVETGLFKEILPIIIPARTAVVGSELRSVTVEPNDPITELADDSGFTIATLNRISNILGNLLNGNQISKSAGNTAQQTILFQEDGVTKLSMSLPVVLSIQNLIADIINYVALKLQNGEIEPTLIGTNTAQTNIDYINATLILEVNREFLMSEAVAFMTTTFPTYSFDSDLCKRDVSRYIDAWKYDIIYTGNYKSLLSARYYVNAVLGSKNEDMFYCRDATGVRNMTLKGLEGILNPPSISDIFRRPTGGSFISLDPGWGPDDDRTWILNRSPYIQGVTNFGYAAIGQKIDGALHNGGNKSIVSNDFTQVISDGIGAYVLNQGRAELVSVFTYYAHIGYFAENGGIIRGTNGNCSYGTFGAVADGVDSSETPTPVTVNTRNQQAIVASAFAGEFVDEIQILEWQNAGEAYTQATASFVGAGFGVSTVFEDFRDNAVFEVRPIDVGTDIVQVIGGSGYSVSQNNAQASLIASNDRFSITISQSDNNQQSDYLGKRIIITGGTGTGQYGYITAYDTTTKIVSVSRESDDQLGWDNVIPGRPPVVPLDTTTVYRIEPRPIFSPPEYQSTNGSFPVSTNWISGSYGLTTETFSSVAVGLGTASIFSPVAATFNVQKSGRQYSLTLVSEGAGYEVGDELFIFGTSVGGVSPNNDITIIVTEISDDPEKSIVNFDFQGRGNNGKFLAINSIGGGASSINGINWTSFSMPTVGNWVSVANGNNIFVAIRKGSSSAAYSLNGSSWQSSSLPGSRQWEDIAFGENRFVVIASDQNSAAYSNTGTNNWILTSMPVAGDSTFNEWCAITYGKNLFVAVARSQNMAARSSDGITWTAHVMDVIDDSTQKDWTSITYGNNRFVAISSQGDVSYSFDGISWYGASLISNPSNTQVWKKIKYQQGVFLAIGEEDTVTKETSFFATSFDGIVWTARNASSTKVWNNIIAGNPIDALQDSSVGLATPIWLLLPDNSSEFSRIKTGKTAVGRPVLNAGRIVSVKIWDPGSGYVEDPSVTFVDPGSTPALYECRLGDGVLSNPSWIARGTGFRTTTTRVTISGNGYADIFPSGNDVTISGLENYFGPGAQITFQGKSQIYTIVKITELGNINYGNGLSARLRVTPIIKIRDKIEHDSTAQIRLRYSQVRITGHDFLDIGTGNFVETNYPELYNLGVINYSPENEVVEEEGGRVFYTATDQSGNFRTGELFAVEQATGVVTISSDFFDLSGLTELRLGGVRVGGSGVVVREFSRDPTFAADSNNVVPTQRAIRGYLSNRLTVGGSEVATASFIAGQVRVGPNRIANTVGGKIIVRARVNMTKSVRGSILAQTMFYRSFT